MANKTLTAKVKLDTKSAEQKLKRLNTLIKGIDKAVNGKSNNSGLERALNKQVIAAEKVKQATLKTQLAEERLATQKQKTALASQKVATATEQANKSANKFSMALKTSQTHANGLVTTMKRLASTYLGVMGLKAVTSTSDTIISTQNKVNTLNGGDTTATKEQMDKMYASANKVRMEYTDMMANASKSMTLAGSAFQGDMDNAIRFQEIMAETYALGGASAPEMSTSMYQMIQALGAGTLAGDELRSVREGAPLAYKAIENFAQGVYDTDESLKDLASQGKITSDMVVAAIMNAGDRIDKQFEDTYITFGQAWNRIKNAAVKAFEPVSNMLRDMLQRANENGVFEKIETAFWNISKVIQIVFKLIENTITWIADNWNWLKHILIAGLIAYASYLIVTTGIAIAQAVARIIAWLQEYGSIMLVVAAVLALVYVFYLWKTGAIDTCTAVGIALLAIAAICFVLFGWVAGLIVAALGLIVWFFDYFCYGCAFVAAVLVDALSFIWNVIWWVIQAVVTAIVWLVVVALDILASFFNMFKALVNLILGIVFWAFAMVYNLFVGIVNACLQQVWAFVDPFLGIIEFILNACNGGFNSFGDAVANLIGQVISWFLSLGKVVTTIIDAIFGTNWTAGLSSLQDKVLSWGKNEESITINREAPKLQRMDATNAAKTGLTAWEYTELLKPGEIAGDFWKGMDGLHTGYANPLDWGDAAFDWGEGIMGSVNDWGSQFQTADGKSLFDLDKIGNALGLDFSSLGNGFPSADDFNLDDAYKMPSIEELLEGIKDDTGDINDSLDLSNDDLEYLRRIADMEWRNEFTTAEIKVDMTNNNTVNGERDLDGIVEYLSDTLRAEMANVAYGVHY